jgi:N-acetylglucosaminyl-diphospho-decaprenol L-rhamnosyltransferase
MLLSVVVVNWNSRDDLRACLSSLAAQTHRELEVIVVDNGSSDGSAEMVGSEFPASILIREHDNLGFAAGCNRGIDASHGDWVALLNNDAVAERGWAKALVEAIERAPSECGMLQSLLVYQERPGIVNSTGIELTHSGGGRDRDGGKALEDATPSPDILCPTAGAAAYRRAMLDDVRLPNGFFDEDHFMYYEDLDLGWRARLAGWSARYVGDSVVLHRWHGSSDRHGPSWLVVISCTNRLRTLLKNASVPFIVRTSPRTVLELAKLIWHGKSAAAISLARAIRTSVRLRARVGAMSRIPRRTLEQKWTAPPS